MKTFLIYHEILVKIGKDTEEEGEWLPGTGKRKCRLHIWNSVRHLLKWMKFCKIKNRNKLWLKRKGRVSKLSED
jgi:hypothetical protein